MTREEAKSEIMQIYGALSPNKQRAIDTLVKIEPCNDAVSRQAVLDTLMKCEEPCDDRQDFYLDLTTEFEEKIKELPPVTPKPKTGYWINRRIIANTSIDMIVCSECGQEFSYDAETGISISDYNYCPNCGAEMENGK